MSETRAALTSLLGKGVKGTVLKARLLWLKVRWGWKSLSLKNQGQGRFKVVGSMSPSEELAEGSSEVTVKAGATKEPPAGAAAGAGATTPAPTVPEGPIEFRERAVDPSAFRVADRARALLPAPVERLAGKRSQGANPWELATNPLVTRVLAPEIAGGRDVRVATTPNQRRLESTKNRLVVIPQKRERDPTTGAKRRPDFMAEVVGRDPATGERRTEEVHYIEQTVDVNIVKKSGGPGAQAGTNTRLHLPCAEKVPGRAHRYHIVAPVLDSPLTPKGEQQAGRWGRDAAVFAVEPHPDERHAAGPSPPPRSSTRI